MLKDSCDSLGARSLPEPYGPASPSCVVAKDDARRENYASSRRVSSNPETLPVALSDVSFFNDSDVDGSDDRAFQRTLAIVKPEAAHLMYQIECVMARKGFIIIKKDVLRLTREQAAEFYGDHALELYYPRLVDHMSGGPVAVYVLAKKNCVDEWRRLIGPADVPLAKRCFPVSLRAVYGTESTAAPVANALHGSDSPAAAKREIRFFFPNVETDEAADDANDEVQYIHDVLMPTISKGLSDMFKINPNDPLRWFGNWLLTKTTDVQKS